MSQNLTTLETVFNRIDAMAANQVDHFVDVADIGFENLQTVKIGGHAHPLEPSPSGPSHGAWGYLSITWPSVRPNCRRCR